MFQFSRDCQVQVIMFVCVCVADSEGSELVALFRTNIGHYLLVSCQCEYVCECVCVSSV